MTHKTAMVVTGATGNVGRPLVTHLAEAGVEVRAITRQAHTAAFPLGVESFESVSTALTGASTVFLNSRALGDGLVATVEAARAAGVTRLVALSAINADDDFSRQSSRLRGDRNYEVEQFAASSGLEWVSLRPSVFATNFAGMWAPQLRGSDVVNGPFASASTAPITEVDIAAVAARAMLADDLVGQRIPMTGPQSITNVEMVEAIGTVLGRNLRYQEIPPDLVRQRFIDLDFGTEFADAYIAMLAETVDRPALVTPDVEKILDRPAQPFAQWVADHRDSF